MFNGATVLKDFNIAVCNIKGGGRVVQYTRTVTVRIIHVTIRTDRKDLKKWHTVRKGPDTTIFTKLNRPSLSNTCPVSITPLPETCLKQISQREGGVNYLLLIRKKTLQVIRNIKPLYVL